MAVVCTVSATLLAALSLSLREIQKRAYQVDQSRQMLQAAAILDHQGHRLEEFLPEKRKRKKATDGEVMTLYQRRIRPILVDERGNRSNFEEQSLSLSHYLKRYEGEGYAHLPWKILYEILSSEGKERVVGYILPIFGFGLWNSIHGYLAVGGDGNTILGTTWYKHEETPGLGANITLPQWQKSFVGKKIFQPDGQGYVDLESASMGIHLIKGGVQRLPPHSSKREVSVDGIPGATLTSQGVMQAYKHSLTPYRYFFIRMQKEREGESL